MVSSDTESKHSSFSSYSILLIILTTFLVILITSTVLIIILKSPKQINTNSSSITTALTESSTSSIVLERNKTNNLNKSSFSINVKEKGALHPLPKTETSVLSSENSTNLQITKFKQPPNNNNESNKDLSFEQLLLNITKSKKDLKEILNYIFKDNTFTSNMKEYAYKINGNIDVLIGNSLKATLKENKKLNLTFFEFLNSKINKIQFLENIKTPILHFTERLKELKENGINNTNIIDCVNNLVISFVNRYIYNGCLKFYNATKITNVKNEVEKENNIKKKVKNLKKLKTLKSTFIKAQLNL